MPMSSSRAAVTCVVSLADESHLRRAVPDSDRPALKLLHEGHHAFGRADYPLDRLVFHLVGNRALGLSEYYNGIFYEFRNAVDH